MAAEGRRQDRGTTARREDDRVRRREGGQASRGPGDGEGCNARQQSNGREGNASI